MISDVRLAQFAAATYTAVPTWTGVGLDQSIHACRTDEDGLVVVAFRGSIAPHDWIVDFAARPMTVIDHATIGHVHAGFLAAALSVLPRVALGVEGKSYVLCGHSLGGALALLVGALMADENHPPERILTLGGPKVGFPPYASELGCVEVAQYRRGNDPVPEVPMALPGLPWVHARLPLIEVGVPQDDPFSCHSAAGYVDDVTALFTTSKAA